MSRDQKSRHTERPSVTDNDSHSAISGLQNPSPREQGINTGDQVGLFSSFIDHNPETASLDTSRMEDRNPPLTDDLMNDMFSNLGNQSAYRDDDLGFFNFMHDLDGTNPIEGLRPTITATTHQNNPFYSHPIAGSHPSIVIPANISSDTALPRNIAPVPQPLQSRRQILRIDPTMSAPLPMPSPSFETFSFTPPQPRTTPATNPPIQFDPFAPWTFDPSTLDDLGQSPFSEGTQTPNSEFRLLQKSKSTSPTIPLSRRKNSAASSTESSSQTKPTKTSHNMIEKRYRLKLNDKILSLRNAVPALRGPSNLTEDQQLLDSGRGGTSGKLNKGTVLTKATEYIKQLEREKSTLEEQVKTLRDELAKRDLSEQGFEWGGVAAASSKTRDDENVYVVPVNGMISPESCTSLMSPEAEGSLFAAEVDVLEKLRPRKRVKVGTV
jgi:hypothetical protein